MQLAMAYTTGSAYTIDYWKKLACDMESMGADSICIKDMAGILTPDTADRLIRELKSRVSVPIQLHSHCTGRRCADYLCKRRRGGLRCD